MAKYTERVQTVLSKDQIRSLQKLSRRSGKPISILLREAIDQVYFRRVSLEQKRIAASLLSSLRAPVADWEQMEKQIIRGARQR